MFKILITHTLLFNIFPLGPVVTNWELLRDLVKDEVLSSNHFVTAQAQQCLQVAIAYGHIGIKYLNQYFYLDKICVCSL